MRSSTIPRQQATMLQDDLVSSLTDLTKRLISEGHDRDFILAGIAAYGLSMTHATGGNIHDVFDNLIDAIDLDEESS